MSKLKKKILRPYLNRRNERNIVCLFLKIFKKEGNNKKFGEGGSWLFQQKRGFFRKPFLKIYTQGRLQSFTMSFYLGTTRHLGVKIQSHSRKDLLWLICIIRGVLRCF